MVKSTARPCSCIEDPGLRRIPTQLLESGLALVDGGAATTVAIVDAASPPGLVFAAAIGAYTLGRQLLFPLRDPPRNTASGRIATLALAAAELVAASTTIAVASSASVSGRPSTPRRAPTG